MDRAAGPPPVRSQAVIRRQRVALAVGLLLLTATLATAFTLDRRHDEDGGRTAPSTAGAAPTVTSAPSRAGRLASTSTTAIAPTTTLAPSTTSTAVPPPPCPATAWTPRQRVAQLIMVGVDPSGAAEARQVVEVDHLGGVFIGGTATELLASGVLRELRGPDGVAPFVAVDEEGGRVQRIDGLDGDLPSARVLAASRSLAEITDLAERRGRALAAYGVTVDFAPNVDVSVQKDGEVIGDRSFGADPDTVARNARAFATGLDRAGVLPVFKHFPGHGHAVGDSHEGTSTAPALADLEPDLEPYRVLLGEPGRHAVMIGHLVVPDLTDGEPASLSPAAIDGLLRRDLGYDGLVFTDELGGMRAVADRYGPADAVRRALIAGADVALLADGADVDGLLDDLEADLAEGRLPQAVVDVALRRVLAAKGYACSP